MNYLFLDIDGVINASDEWHEESEDFDISMVPFSAKYRIDILNRLFDEFNYKLIICSSWRVCGKPRGLAVVTKLTLTGLNPAIKYSVTPEFNDNITVKFICDTMGIDCDEKYDWRCYEILNELYNQGFDEKHDSFAILEDSKMLHPKLVDQWIQCDPNKGLQEHHYEMIRSKLKKNTK